MIYLKNFENRSDYNDFLNDDGQEKFHNTSLVSGKTEYDKYASMPLTFQIIGNSDYEEGDTYTIYLNYGVSDTSLKRTIEYRINGGEWDEVTFGDDEIDGLEPGDLVEFYCSETGPYDGEGEAYHCTFGTDVAFNVFGNINSLNAYSDNLSSYQYRYLFYLCDKLISAKNLVLPSLYAPESCYRNLFRDCTNLVTAPSILPATEVDEFGYQGMFSGCHALKNPPKLMATTLAYGSCKYMFEFCTSLKESPEIIVEMVGEYCFEGFFKGCKNLIKPPKKLPALTLAEYCYINMFSGCTNLKTAPELPATELTDYCYQSMFIGCTNLKYIKCLATSTAYGSTNVWVSGVQTTSGTFVKHPSMESWSFGISGIPDNWTVQEA